ncbi:MAG: hypothetical protein RL186_422 [Pseudomonadota bacterium]
MVRKKLHTGPLHSDSYQADREPYPHIYDHGPTRLRGRLVVSVLLPQQAIKL